MEHRGDPTEEKCPKCPGRILYNGNHFCEFFQDGCDWALPHPQELYRDQLISFRLSGYYEDGNDGTDLGGIIRKEPPEPFSEHLDEIWRKAVEDGEQDFVELEKTYEDLVEKSEKALIKLRAMAAMKGKENNG